MLYLTLSEQLEKFGTFRDMTMIIRMIENIGYEVIDWNGLTLEVADYGTLNFKVENNRLILQK